MDVVAAVVRRGSRFLLCQRPLEKNHGGMWEFPGGKVGAGETMYGALRRELREELAVRSQPIRAAIPSAIYSEEDFEFALYFIETEIQGEPTLLEHEKLGWFAIDEILTLELAPADAEFVARYFLNSSQCDIGG